MEIKTNLTETQPQCHFLGGQAHLSEPESWPQSLPSSSLLSWWTFLPRSYGSQWRCCPQMWHSWWGSEHIQHASCTRSPITTAVLRQTKENKCCTIPLLLLWSYWKRESIQSWRQRFPSSYRTTYWPGVHPWLPSIRRKNDYRDRRHFVYKVYLHIKCQVFEIPHQFSARPDNSHSPGIYFNRNTFRNFDGLRHQNLLHLAACQIITIVKFGEQPCSNF